MWIYSLLVRDVFHSLEPLPWVSVIQEGRDDPTLQDAAVGVLFELLRTP